MAIPKAAPKAKPTEPKFVDRSEAEALEREIRERISERAYRFYEESGYQEGHAEEHWRQAESEILKREIEVRESGSWIAANATIPGASAEDVHIYVDPVRVVVRTKSAAEGKAETNPAKPDVFLAADLNVEVDPSTASASFKDGKLSLMVKKRAPTTGSDVLHSTPRQ